MKKKSIIVACLVLSIITVMSACGKKSVITNKEGVESPVVTDAEGNTIVNDFGEIVVYATDSNKKYVTNQNGERETAGVTFPEIIVQDNVYETIKFKMTFPKEWDVDVRGKATLKSNDKTSIKIQDLGPVLDGESIGSLTDNQYQSVNSYIDKVKEQYPNSTLEREAVTITQKELPGEQIVIKYIDSNNKVVYFAQCTYFIYNNDKYALEYRVNGEGYDESINAIDIINQGLLLK